MKRSGQQSDELDARSKRIALDVSSRAEEKIPQTLDVAIYNMHLCEMCRQVLDYVRGLPLPDWAILVWDTEFWSAFQWDYNTRSLQQSAEEGCYVCMVIRNHTLRSRHLYPCPAIEMRLSECVFKKDVAGNIKRLEWELVQTDDDFFSDVDRNDSFKGGSFPVLHSSVVPGPFLGDAPNGSSNTDILLRYQPVVDMTENPLWELITQWIELCSAHHECSHIDKGANASTCAFPTRLIRVTTTDAGIEARLVETHENGFVREPYLTLSHVWGTERFLTLTSSNIHHFYDKISLDELPHTFVDVFKITQRLGFRYVWIDSLCIKQDRIEDWRYESSRMGDIYRGSACNIAAGIASTGSQHLINRLRNVEDIALLRFSGLPSREKCKESCLYPWSNEIDDLLLNRRAWVLQERLLAPRVLYFGLNQVFWECAGAVACEAIPEGLPSDSIGKDLKAWRAQLKCWSLRALNENKRDVINESTRLQYEKWYELVEAYSACGLTKEGDKLIALSGIAKEFQGFLKDQYLAGLWKGNLVAGLLWYVPGTLGLTQRAQGYRAPSWSWATIEGNISFSGPRVEHELVEIKEVFTEPASGDPTGEVVHGYIKLSGILRKVTIARYNECTRYMVITTELGCDFDVPEDYQLTDIHCLPLALTRYPFGVAGLLLKSTGSGSRQYQRVGAFTHNFRGSDRFADILGIPRALFDEPRFSSLLERCDEYVRNGSWGSDYDEILTEIISRALKYCKPSMEAMTII